MTTKICSVKNGCGCEKDISEFCKNRNMCKKCKSIYNKKYVKENADKINSLKIKYNEINKEKNRNRSKQYRLANKEKIKISKQKYSKDHREQCITAHRRYRSLHREECKKYSREYSRKYTLINKEKLKKYRSEYSALRSRYDILYKIKRLISSSINNHLKRKLCSKNHKSSINYLSYSTQDLKEHIEKQFEPWMNWNNRGNYKNDIWNDNDTSTWTWQLDHIIPQSKLPYSSMEDDNFKKCWALENLRPYSAKQNIIDGNRRNI